MRQFSSKILLGILCFLFLLVYLIYDLSVFTQSQDYSFESLLQILNSQSFQMRLSRLFTVFVSGSLLALGGYLVQLIFRNTLIDAQILGISGGASLSLLISVLFFNSLDLILEDSLLSYKLISVLGSFITCFIILLIQRTLPRRSLSLLPLVGLCLNIFYSSLIFILIFFYQDYSTQITYHMIGDVRYYSLKSSSLFLIANVVLCLFLIKKSYYLKATSLGMDFSKTLGFHYKNEVMKYIVIICLMVSLSVILTGPISFLGIFIPHFVRLVKRNLKTKKELFLNYLTGGLFLLCVDFVSRNIAPPLNIPIGAITAIIGAPIFVLIVVKERRYDFDS